LFQSRPAAGPLSLILGAVNAVAQTFAIIAALCGVTAFVLESFLFGRPSVQTFLLGRPEPAASVRMWAFNQGFYNLFLATGPAAGVVAYHLGQQSAGRALVIYGCAFMTGCGVILFVSDRRLWRGMIGQSGPPLVALIAALM
jgi:putative membrane protein